MLKPEYSSELSQHHGNNRLNFDIFKFQFSGYKYHLPTLIKRLIILMVIFFHHFKKRESFYNKIVSVT